MIIIEGAMSWPYGYRWYRRRRYAYPMPPYFTPYYPPYPLYPPSPEDELRMLEEYREDLQLELEDLRSELEGVEARIAELKKRLGKE